MRPEARGRMAILVAARAVSSIGDLMYLVAINIFLLSLTHAPIAVAGLWLVGRVGALIVSPWAGSLTDRMRRRDILMAVDLLRAAGLLLMPFLHNLWLVYLDIAWLGVLGVFFGTAFLPYQTQIVPLDRQKRLNGLIALARYSAILIGPSLAGLLMLSGSVRLPLWSDGASFVLSAASLLLLPRLEAIPAARPGHQDRTSLWHTTGRDWLQAWHLLSQAPVFRLTLIASVGILALGVAADSQEVVFAVRALHLGHFGFAMMVTAAGVGYVFGALLLNTVIPRIPVKWLLTAGMLGSTLGYLTYALSPGFTQAVVGLVMLGTFGGAQSVGFTSFQQRSVAPELMGRVMNLRNTPEQLLQLLLILAAGWATDLLGIRAVMVAATALAVLLAVSMVSAILKPRHQAELAALDTVVPKG